MIIAEAWKLEVYGDPMYCIVMKLKEAKKKLKTWAYNIGTNIHKRVIEAKKKLKAVQRLLKGDTTNSTLAVEEKRILDEYSLFCDMETLEMRQK